MCLNLGFVILMLRRVSTNRHKSVKRTFSQLFVICHIFYLFITVIRSSTPRCPVYKLSAYCFSFVVGKLFVFTCSFSSYMAKNKFDNTEQGRSQTSSGGGSKIFFRSTNFRVRTKKKKKKKGPHLKSRGSGRRGRILQGFPLIKISSHLP